MNGEVYKLVLTAIVVLAVGSIAAMIELAWHRSPDRTAGTFLLISIISAIALVGILLWAGAARAW